MYFHTVSWWMLSFKLYGLFISWDLMFRFFRQPIGSQVKSAASKWIEVIHCDKCVISPQWHFSLSICVVPITLRRTAVALSSDVYLHGANQASHKSTISWSRMRTGPPLVPFVQTRRVLGQIVPRDEACSYGAAIQSSPRSPKLLTTSGVTARNRRAIRI